MNGEITRENTKNSSKNINSDNIDGLKIITLHEISDERGTVMKVLPNDHLCFNEYGEIYCSIVKKGTVEPWKKHREMKLSVVVPVGEIQFVIFDDRKDSSTRGKFQEIYIGQQKYSLIQIPSNVWYGFMGIGTFASNESLIIYCTDKLHDSSGVERLPSDSSSIPYQFSKLLSDSPAKP